MDLCGEWIRNSTMRTERPGRAVVATLPLVLAAALAIAPSAYGKGDMTAEVCGAARCVPVADRADLGFLHSTGGTRGSPAAAPFYVVRFRGRAVGGSSDSWSYIWVPSVRAQRANDFGHGSVSWRSARFLAPLLGPMTKGLEPYPASSTWSPAARPTTQADDFPVAPVARGALATALGVGLLVWLARTRRRASAAAR
jgi:hypothetical protein